MRDGVDRTGRRDSDLLGSGRPPDDQHLQSIITRYLGDVAAASGTHSDVFSTLNEYFGSNGNISYQVRLGTPVDDMSPLPKSSCNLTNADRTGIYADGSGYDACLDDAQVVQETTNVVTAKGLPVDLAHI